MLGVVILLLDVMGTVVREPFVEDMPRFFGMTLDELIEAKHPDLWVRFERGEVDGDEFLRGFFADGRDYDREGFVRCIRAAYRFLPGMESLLRSIRVPTYALSNYPRWSEWIDDSLSLHRYLDWRFVSWKTGVRKPDPEAYLGPIRELGESADHFVFVDVREVNVVAAREVGMHAIRFENAVQLGAQLDALGLLKTKR